MKRASIITIAVGLVITVSAIAAVAYVTALDSVPTGQGITLSPNQVNHPPGCDTATDRTVSSGGLSLMVESTSAPTLTSSICLQFVLTNNNPLDFPIYKYMMEINVTDSSGKVVFHQDWGVVSPPNQLWNLTAGKFWEEGTYWHPAQSGVLTAGTYHVTATMFLPGSTAVTYRSNVFMRNSLDINLQT